MTEFRTHARFSKRMNTLLKYFPFVRFERNYYRQLEWQPVLQFGLTVSTFYPDPDPESTSVDGDVQTQ